jgi:hypothetical protein
VRAAALIASATVEKCVAGSAQAAGSVTFAAQMDIVPGADEMGVRVDLQERTPESSRFHAVNAPGLGVWHQSEPSVKVFRYLAQVTNLAAPASYRALVSFRWLDPGGHIISRASRRTPVCRQAAIRPDALRRARLRRP